MSDDFYSVDLTGDRKLLSNFEGLPGVIRQIIHEKVEQWVEQTRDLVEEFISERLQTKTGLLESSVQTEVTVEGLRIHGRVYIAGVPYARIQDKGGVTSPHIIRPVEAKILAFYAASGHKVFALRVFHPGATIPASNFMRDAYREMSPKISSGIYQEIVRKTRGLR